MDSEWQDKMIDKENKRQKRELKLNYGSKDE